MKTSALKSILFTLSVVPFISLAGRVFFNNLGANPIEYILHSTGWWTLTFLIITLAISPIRKLTKWNKVIKFRRMLGLFAFFYAFLHFIVYLGIDRFFNWSEIIKDVTERPYITVGFTAFILLIPLALTSTKALMRRLGKKWQKIHRLIYLVTVLGVLHFWWLVKKDISEPFAFAVMVAVLLMFRLSVIKNLVDRLHQRLSNSQKTAGSLS